ncbi:hypothetical protein MBT84_05685 [Streptomyces sp. MBT84]|uniref:hypothetical protein n=1 Tax=Streptomyces sp. MBT84 TaxID=1488414 RepID=UPI001C6E368B|nr:hypothetical protein [Streptomyces sp. MBT84]MBW8699072.1 hypothetical protein [Streptomyces sp. MBT84]
MLQLRRIRLDNIGHRAAGFKSLVLDLTGGPVSIDGRPARPVDVILWLRNGGGKSSLLCVLFSLLLPAKKDFIGAPQAKSLAEYIPGGQVSHVIAEWGDTERPASGAVLVTGGVYQWRDGQRPADPSSGWERLERRWYLLRPLPGGLELDSLPVRAEDLQLSMSSYMKALEAQHKLQRGLQLVVAEEQYTWEEQLSHHGLDPQVFMIQKAMNQEEGGITELFKFRTAEEFIDFLIDMIVDTAEPTAARTALSKHADKLAARPAREVEERFLAEAVLRLRPVQKATAEAALAEQAVSQQIRLARRAGEHIQDHAERREQESGSLRGRAEADAREAQEADDRVEGRRRRVAAVGEASARLRARDCANEHARCLEAADSIGQEHTAWQAVPLLMELADREAERRQVNQMLGDLHSERAPLREAVEQAGAALYARLEDGLARLTGEEDQARADLETVAAQVEAAEREFEEAVSAASRADARATSAEARREEGRAAIVAARASGVLGPQEEPHAALERLAHEEDAARAHMEQARLQRRAARERSATIAAERLSCAGRLSTARQRHDHVWEQWNTLARERSALVAEPRLGELAGTGGGPGHLDLDAVGTDLIAMLTEHVAHADAELAAERAQASEDQRLRDALEHDGFCPPPREVEQAVAALRDRGANAVAGMQFLRETVPAHRHDEVIVAIPQLIGGVVICGPVPGGDLAALARQANVSLPTVIAVSSDDEARALLSRKQGDIAVLPIRPSVLDLQAGEEELRRVTERLDTLEERLQALTARREADRALTERLRTHLASFDTRSRATLEELLSQLDDEVSTLTEHTGNLAHKAEEAAQSGRRAEQQLVQHTDALMTLTQTLPQIQALQAAAQATVHWTAEGRQARTEERAHRAAAQHLKQLCASARRQKRTAEAALRQCQERGERWTGWMEEIRRELPDEVINRCRPGTVPDGSLQALRERWGQARRDWRDGISDTTLQQRLTAAQTAIDALNQKLATAGFATRARASELARQAEAADTDRLADRIAAAAQAHRSAERAEHEADLLHRQALAAHQKAAAQLAELVPDAQQVSFPSVQAALDELHAEEHRLEQDRALAQVRRLDAERTHRTADLAASHAAQLRQSAGGLSATTDRQPDDDLNDDGDGPELSVDALLLERHGLSAVTAQSLQPQDAERIKDAITRDVVRAVRAHDSAKTTLRKYVQQVERLALQPEYATVVDGRLRDRLQQDLTLPTRLAALLEDIEERERQVVALLAESEEDQARVVDACASMVEAVLDTVEEVARHSRLPGNLGSWSTERFLSLELGQRARGDELARRLSAEVDRLISSLPASAAGRASALPEAMPLAKRLVLAALGGHGNIIARIIKPTQNLDTVERESVTEIQKFSGGELLTVSVLLYCTLARMRASQRDRRIPGGVGTLVLDNPFGKANYGPFVDLQRRVAGAHGIQLVYTTGSNDRPALSRFPLIIRMRNGVDLRTKHRYIQVLERYGDAVADGVTRAQGDGIASARLLRRSALPPETSQNPKAPEQEAG